MAKRATKKTTTKKGARKATKASSSSRTASSRSSAKRKTTRRAAASGSAASSKVTGRKKASKKKAVAKKVKTRKPGGRKTVAKKAVAEKATGGSVVAASRATAVIPAGDNHRSATPKPPKCPLNKRELDAYRQLLLAKRSTLVGDVTNMTDEALRKSRQNSSGDLSNMPIHMADLGSDNFEQEFTLGLIENEHALLRDIDEALQRIEDRTYGICLATGKPISKARLKARPWAKYCIEHARRLERGF